MKKALTLLAITIASCFSTTEACTDVRLISKDNTVLVARSMEFGLDLQSRLRSSPRGRVYTATALNNKPAMSWKANYGYLFVDGLGQNFTVDGMNEAGLSFEYLYLPGNTQYQTVPPGKEQQAIPYFYLGDWVLSQFKSVDEVKQALNNLYVYQQSLSVAGNVVFPLHAAIYDTSGKGIIVEFVQGRMQISDSIGILTNSPLYDWQTVNLQNYLNLSPYNPKPIVADGMTYAATGQGAGMVGLPGDVSPPSRFVKMSFMAQTAYPAADAVGVLNLAQHLLNNVDIPFGLVRAVSNGKESSDSTQWVVFKDLTHKVFYYRTYNDMTIRAVAMNKIDFSPQAAALAMPLQQPAAYVMDVSAQFVAAKTN